ncbi:DUF397 domain-containing protein [Streptomyces sp. NPDC051554]|uniref:DUF397 domain-containing protein n=1 Tax=Streptomyces sp. NPDC051554 TaxID=3365656 RepID=UPI0037A4CCD7
MENPTHRFRWFKSSYSGNLEECVEVAVSTDILVRDSKGSLDSFIEFDPGAWKEFVNSVKRA